MDNPVIDVSNLPDYFGFVSFLICFLVVII